MAYYTDEQLQAIGFKKVGKSVKVSDKAIIYNADQMEIGDYSRIDDFCILSGVVSIGRFCHVTPMCLIAGGIPGVFMEDFTTLAYGVKIFSQSDDYSGETMTNSLIPKKFKKEILLPVYIKRQSIIGAGSIILPGVTVEQGCSTGAMTLLNKSTDPWGVYVGNPAKRLKDRKKDLLLLEEQFIQELSNDSV